MLLEKWRDRREAEAAAKVAAWGEGEVFVAYLKRSREALIKEMLQSSGDELVKKQGMVLMLDDIVERLATASQTMEKMPR